MNWNPYPQNVPTESKTYLLSVQRNIGHTTFTFNYIGYFNADTQTWHKYDGFDDNSIKEPITDVVTAWITNLSVFVI